MCAEVFRYFCWARKAFGYSLMPTLDAPETGPCRPPAHVLGPAHRSIAGSVLKSDDEDVLHDVPQRLHGILGTVMAGTAVSAAAVAAAVGAAAAPRRRLAALRRQLRWQRSAATATPAAAAAAMAAAAAPLPPAAPLTCARRAPPGWRVGHCACHGGARARIAVDPAKQLFGVYCHCRRCQRFHGAPYAAILGFRKDSVVLLLDEDDDGDSAMDGVPAGISCTPDGYRVVCSSCMAPICNNSRSFECVGTFPTLFAAMDEPDPLRQWRWDRHECVHALRWR
jgi:hypothetical protein